MVKTDALENYIYILQAIQDFKSNCGYVETTPYGLEAKRQELHKELLKDFNIEDNIENYDLSKKIFSNLDKICSFYSDEDEWKLKSDYDCNQMMKYLTDYLIKYKWKQKK